MNRESDYILLSTVSAAGSLGSMDPSSTLALSVELGQGIYKQLPKPLDMRKNARSWSCIRDLKDSTVGVGGVYHYPERSVGTDNTSSKTQHFSKELVHVRKSSGHTFMQTLLT